MGNAALDRSQLQCQRADDFEVIRMSQLSTREDIGTVFISYSHDSLSHAHAVLALSDKLRSEGIDCVLDQYETSPPEGWPRWMDREIRDAKFVLMICTELYHRRVMNKEEVGVGLGVRWEGNLICQHIYNEGSTNTKLNTQNTFQPHFRGPPDTASQIATINCVIG
jgi:TIR domain